MDRVTTKIFWNKLETKRWLAENTTLNYPPTIAGPSKLGEMLKILETLEPGSWVLKPTKGRKSTGVVLFDKSLDNLYKIFSTDEWLPLDLAINPFMKSAKKKVITKKIRGEVRQWFIEPWIAPHEKLKRYTAVTRCPPIIRFYCRPEVNFIGLCPIFPEFTGLSCAGWDSRHYMWLDLKGVVRHPSEIDLTGIDKTSVKIFEHKTLEVAPYGSCIEGIPAIIEQINAEVAPKVELYKHKSWGLEGTFDQDNNFICIELNHSPGSQFQQYNWK
jgi:hypothetical protein